MPGHSVPLAGLGGFILIFGFLAFNGGSQVGYISEVSDFWQVMQSDIQDNVYLDDNNRRLTLTVPRQPSPTPETEGWWPWPS